MQLQCFATKQWFYLSFPPYVLSLLHPPSSLVSSLYRLPVHLMPKENSAAGTATAASYLILPKGVNWCWQHALQAEVLSCLFLRRCKPSPSSPFHIARRRVKCLPFLCFFFFFQPQNALGNEMFDFSSSSSCCRKNTSNKQIQFTL